MSCLTCHLLVKYELEKLGLTCISIEPGRVESLEAISIDQMNRLGIAFNEVGLELMNDKRNLLIEKIKMAILNMVDDPDDPLKINFSNYLSNRLNLDYTYLANIFSDVQGISIKQYIIKHKVKKVKQLICDGQFNLTEISRILDYSSVAHLSTQFKKVTGVTPSHYKCLNTVR